MRDARRISTREVSQGVQRHVLAQTTWFGSTVVALSCAAPLVFERLTAGSGTECAGAEFWAPGPTYVLP